MRIILLGPPGSGKGTQGDLIQEKYALPRISSGDLLRDAVQKATPLGRQAEAFMNRGELVSDSLVVNMIQERILQPDCQNGYILDGFPRTIPQAEHLDEIEPDSGEIVLDIQVPDEVIIERLSARRICSECGTIFNIKSHPERGDDVCTACGGRLIQRDDDKADVINNRLEVYHRQTQPLAQYYRAKNIYHTISGQGTVTDIFTRVVGTLEQLSPDLKIKRQAAS